MTVFRGVAPIPFGQVSACSFPSLAHNPSPIYRFRETPVRRAGCRMRRERRGSYSARIAPPGCFIASWRN